MERKCELTAELARDSNEVAELVSSFRSSIVNGLLMTPDPQGRVFPPDYIVTLISEGKKTCDEVAGEIAKILVFCGGCCLSDCKCAGDARFLMVWYEGKGSKLPC